MKWKGRLRTEGSIFVKIGEKPSKGEDHRALLLIKPTKSLVRNPNREMFVLITAGGSKGIESAVSGYGNIRGYIEEKLNVALGSPDDQNVRDTRERRTVVLGDILLGVKSVNALLLRIVC